jgi:hypothetical protein
MQKGAFAMIVIVANALKLAPGAGSLELSPGRFLESYLKGYLIGRATRRGHADHSLRGLY